MKRRVSRATEAAQQAEQLSNTKKSKPETLGRETSVFFEIITKSGIQETNGRFSITVGLEAFRTTFSSLVSTPEQVKAFLDSFNQSISTSSSAILDKTLCPLLGDRLTTTSPSLFRLLLSFRQLQKQLLDTVFESLLLSSSTAEGDSEAVRRIGLLISHLQWLAVFEPDSFVTKTLEVTLSIPSKTHKKELILALPTIINESHHTKVGESLISLLIEMPSAVLESLSHLALPSTLSAEVTRRSLDALAAADTRDLPALLSFVLNAATEEGSHDVAEKIRKSVNLEHIFEQSRRGKISRNSISSNNQSGIAPLDERELLDSIRFGFRSNKFISIALLQSISSDSCPLKAFDLVCVFIAHSIDQTQKKTVSLIEKNPLIFTRPLIHSTFANHIQAIYSLLPNAMNLAETLVRTGSSLDVKAVGGSIYSAALASFEDSHSTQDILGLLTTHLCSSSTKEEISVTLSVLEEAANSFPRRIQQFSGRLMGLVDHVRKLSLSDVSRLYSVYASLSFVLSPGSKMMEINDHMYNDCFMLLQKQLSRTEIEYRKIGVAGSVAFIARAASKCGNCSEALRIFEMTRTICNSSPIAHGFFYDELTRILSIKHRQFDPDFVAALEKNLPTELYRNFLTEQLSDEEEQWYSLQDKSSMSIIIYRILHIQLHRERICILCPLMRLVALCTKISSGSTRDVDILLCSPLAMFVQMKRDIDKKEGETICLTLFHAIQWIRELLNVFHDTKDEKNISFLKSRLTNLCELEDRFHEACKHYATPKVPLPEPTTMPSPLPKKLLFFKKPKPSDVPITRPLDREAIIDLLFMMINLKKLPVDESKKFRYLLNDLQESTSTISARDSIELERPASFLSMILPILIDALHKKASGASGDNVIEMTDEAETNFSACVIYCLVILHRIINIAMSQRLTTTETWPLSIIIAATPSTTEKGQEGLIEEQISVTFNKYEQLCQNVTIIGGAVSLLMVLSSLANGSRDRCTRLSGIAGELLARTWPGSLSTNDYVKFMLEMFVTMSEDPLTIIESLCTRELESFIKHPNEPSQGHTYGTLGKDTAPIFYRVLFKLLCSVHADGVKNVAPTSAEKVAHETKSIALFAKLANMTQSTELEATKEMLADTLRNGTAFLVSLAKQMKLLTEVFKDFSKEIIASSKELSSGIKQLQAICEHSKGNKSIALSKLVPAAKKSMEIIVYKMKLMLSAHGLLSEQTLQVGNLKQRDIHGHIIPKPKKKKEEKEKKNDDDDDDDNDNDEDEESKEQEDDGKNKVVVAMDDD